MIIKIKEFIRIFKYTWHKYYEDKECAKKCVESLYNLYIRRKEDANKSTLIRKYLKDIWIYLPKKQRVDYVQKTLDLLEYGIHYEYDENNTRIGNPIYNDGYGLCNQYKYLANYLEKQYLKAKKTYKQKNYVEVNSIHKETYEYLNNFDKKIFDL